MSKPAGASAVIAEVAKPHDLKHAKTEVHDAGLQQAKLEREIKGKHELHHVDAPKGGLSDAQKAAYLEDKKAGGKS